MIGEAFGLLLDSIPYWVGRMAIAVISLGKWHCEPWEPNIWTVDLWTGPLRRVSGNQVVVTRRGVRTAGGLVLMLFGFILAGLIGFLIWLLF